MTGLRSRARRAQADPEALATSPTIELADRYCAHNYHPLPVVLIRGSGPYVRDDEDKRYLDMTSAYSAASNGHPHPRPVKTLTEQAATLNIVSRAFHTDRLPPFLARACQLSGMDAALPRNTGGQAVETAMKAASKWAYIVKGVAPGKARGGRSTGRRCAAAHASADAAPQPGRTLSGLVCQSPAEAGSLSSPVGFHGEVDDLRPGARIAGLVVPRPDHLESLVLEHPGRHGPDHRRVDDATIRIDDDFDLNETGLAAFRNLEGSDVLERR